MAALAIASKRSASDALSWAKRGVALAPKRADLQFTLGRALKEAGQLDEAIKAYRRAVGLQPSFAEAWVGLGIALRASGQLDESIRCYQEAIRHKPDLPSAHANLGNALTLRQQRVQAERDPSASEADEKLMVAEQLALDTLRKAVALEPANPTILTNLGAALVARGELEEAAHFFNNALGIDPSREDLCLRLGDCYYRLRELGVAEGIYLQWLKLNPEANEVPLNLGGLLLEVGKYSEAEKWIDGVEKRAPDSRGLPLAQGMRYLNRGDARRGLDYYREAVEKTPAESSWCGYLMLLNYQCEDPALLLSEHSRASGQFGGDSAAALARFAGFHGPDLTIRVQPGRTKRRIGFLSADLRQHSVGYFIENVWRHLDPERFEIVGYHNSVTTDIFSERLKECAVEWVPCVRTGDMTLLRRIRDDDLDVLIDLSGHTGGQRLRVLCARPAPIQMTYLGYPTTTGLREIDYRLTDPVIDPPEGPGFNVESPLRLPNGMFSYRPAFAPETGEPPCFRNGFVTFGSFNNIAKLSNHTLDLWMSVLGSVADSRLYVKSSEVGSAMTRERIQARLEAAGLSRERLIMQRWAPNTTEHLEQYRNIDIALDSYPYNGATTNCEALWMGVPVVTLCGPTHVSRMGASILTSAGQADWIARSEADYRRIATTLASDPEALRAFRQSARTILPQSALFDGPRMGREFATCLDKAIRANQEQTERL
jgi:predicted O-linked N-acetylglucosamine transferase (SPINDLY family)